MRLLWITFECKYSIHDLTIDLSHPILLANLIFVCNPSTPWIGPSLCYLARLASNDQKKSPDGTEWKEFWGTVGVNPRMGPTLVDGGTKYLHSMNAITLSAQNVFFFCPFDLRILSENNSASWAEDSATATPNLSANPMIRPPTAARFSPWDVRTAPRILKGIGSS